MVTAPWPDNYMWVHHFQTYGQDLIIQAYDAHMNLVVGAAEETVQTIDITEDGQAMPGRVGCPFLSSGYVISCLTGSQVEKRNMEMLFVRGDSVILVSEIPDLRVMANHI